MSVWAISDLHLSFARPDRRDRYAGRWRDHAAKIEQNWLEVVQPADLVLLPGDLSMARNHRDLQADLEWLDRLPGTKVFSRGNHDQWWNDIGSVRRLLRRSQLAVDRNAVSTHQVVVCGSAGSAFARRDENYQHVDTMTQQVEAFSEALADAARLRVPESKPLYVLCHFPPFDPHGQPAPWVTLFEQAGVTACLYGHLHIQSQWPLAVQGRIRGVRYYCVAADAIGFRPFRIESPGAAMASPEAGGDPINTKNSSPP
jgi:predicted phosphohydrolase